MKNVIRILFVLPMIVSASEWPGADPGCWKESRYYHSSKIDYKWKANTKFGRIKGTRLEDGTTSPNKSYKFKVEGDRRPNAKVIIFAEKEQLIEISFSNLHGISDIRWVNEKLIFIRPWWGRIAATDIIYDVENEIVISAESVTDGYIAYQQYKNTCANMEGCMCLKTSNAPNHKSVADTKNAQHD